jgi:PTH1 family peptidyl-tRNA hydrolase
VKLIVGLGNPGPEYELSPHNLGFMVVERLAERNAVRLTRKQSKSLCGRLLSDDREVWLIQPQTFMNLSGTAVKEWLAKEGCGPEDLLVVYDELDLPWGTFRIRQRGGAGGHHGLESIISSIGSQDFARLRIGVAPDRRIGDTVEYLLSPVGKSRRREMEEIADLASEAVEAILKHGIARAMNQYNKRAPSEGAEPASAGEKS